MSNNKRGVVLFIVLGVVLVGVILAAVILSIVSSQSRLTHHQVSRIKAYYAAKGIMNYANEKLRKGDWVPSSTAGTFKYACHSSDGTCIDAVTEDYDIPYDNDLGYKVQVKIFPINTADNAQLTGKVTQIEIKTNYTYTP